ncbi:MAG TPA: carbamate kinase [Chloroflexota bacterium]|nr:carbamate kinase [Chloroflexota bacterium]
MSDSLVIAFGGNAIHPSTQTGTLDEQRGNIRRMCAGLGELVVEGHRVVVTHGNGPQVGEIMLRSNMTEGKVPPVTLDVAGAQSQGQIGYMLQQEMGNYLRERGVPPVVATVVTQVVVDPADPAFQNPTKPIGRFYQRAEAEALREERGWIMVEDAGRGYRRVVPSPRPLDIVEWTAVRALFECGVLVIAAGGGGVPVVREGGVLRGIEAVIDKDAAAATVATLIEASTLVLLTEVPAVAVDFGTPRQRPLAAVSLTDMKGHMADGQFPPGSMGPKVRAAIDFLDAGGDRAIITNVSNLVEAVHGDRTGTQVVHDVQAPPRTRPTLARHAP